jgi:prepilin-type processing-associated H-X9-DG protein
MGMVMYAQDYDETFPTWKWDQRYEGGTELKNDAQGLWYVAIYPYVKSAGVLDCPEDPNDFKEWMDPWGWWTGGSSTQRATIYNMPEEVQNAHVSYGANEPLTYNFPGLASMEKPAETLLIADSVTTLTGWDGQGDWAAAVATGNPNDPRLKYRIKRVAYPKGGNDPAYWERPVRRGPFDPAWDRYARHEPGNNIGFADGHVKYTQASRTTVDLYGVK